ncbi:unnamed protein product [Brassica rapa]|uniref:Uncharacterized protein n=1 Tax=Brassica campestris TaxID=3711 RepID=A0A3P6B887_BRACM|nr:unnamed protein product [Brassica rapa]VDC98525.1 unnamed protein product [Brassica rapa]
MVLKDLQIISPSTQRSDDPIMIGVFEGYLIFLESFVWLCEFACLDSRCLCCLLRFDLLPYCSLHAVESGVDWIRSLSLPIDLIEIFTFVKLQFGGFKSFVTTPFRFEDLEMVRLHVMLVLVAWVLNCLGYSQ